MNMTLLVAVMLAFSTSVQSRNTCPTIYNCDTDYNPGDFQSLEQGYFEVDGQECPGCQICIHKADRYFRLLKWVSEYGAIPGRYLAASCFPHTYEDPEFICREKPFYGVEFSDYGFLYHDLTDRCLEEVYPRTGARANGMICPMVVHPHAQYFYHSDGRKCHVYETLNC